MVVLHYIFKNLFKCTNRRAMFVPVPNNKYGFIYIIIIIIIVNCVYIVLVRSLIKFVLTASMSCMRK